jgi:pantetheine-phosphate adenylyltransferase
MANKYSAFFPGSFDPFTLGHEDIIQRGLHLFDRIIIGIGQNTGKKYLLSSENRKKLIETVFEHEDRVSVVEYNGLTVDYCAKNNIPYILRGLRSGQDFEFERTIAQLNQKLNPKIETVFMMSKPEFMHISSTIVREILINQGNAKGFLPKSIVSMIKSLLAD